MTNKAMIVMALALAAGVSHPAMAAVDGAATAAASRHPSASQTSADSQDASSNQLGEIVVTATKRVESLQKVPASIGVLDGSSVLEHKVETIEDISRSVPGISFTAHGGPGQDNISIRGVSSTVGNPTVGIYIDEVPLITASGYEGAATPRLIDLDRVEVLRGPQGTLYGASSEGGTIRFLTKQPDAGHFAATLQADVSGTKDGAANYDVQSAINLPIVKDKVALRISGEVAHNSGYVDNYALDGTTLLNKNVNTEDYRVIHATAKISLDNDFTITPSMFYQLTKTGASPNFFPDLGYYKQSKEVRESGRDELIIPSLTMSKGLGFATATSVTSYYIRNIDRTADGTVFNSAAIALFFLDPAYPDHQAQNDAILQYVPSPVVFTDRFHTFTQELRLSSNGKGPLHWVGGLFYSDQKWTHLDREVSAGFAQAFEQIYGFDINQSVLGDPTNPHLWDQNLVWQVYDTNRVQQYAAFGQIDYDLTRRLHVSAGLRQVHAQEEFSELGAGFFDLGGAGTDGTPYRQHQNFNATTPRFTVNYDASANANIYAAVAKGFRLGGATTPNTNAACVAGLNQLGYTDAPTTYGSDHLWSYELGAKTMLFDRTLSANASVYYIDWKQIQQTIVIPICGGAFNANVGDAQAYGGELEMRWKPRALPGLTLSANFSAEHTGITRTINPDTAAVGQHILNVPDYTISGGVDYNFPLSQSVGAFIHGDYQYIGPSRGSFIVTDTNYFDPAYGVLNVNLGAEIAGTTVSLYVKNLADDKTIIQRPTTNTVVEGYTLRPRTIGITANRKF